MDTLIKNANVCEFTLLHIISIATHRAFFLRHRKCVDERLSFVDFNKSYFENVHFCKENRIICSVYQQLLDFDLSGISFSRDITCQREH